MTRTLVAVSIVLGVAIIAGLVEAAAIRRTGQRRWVLSWLPVALGLVIYAWLDSNPAAPDHGLALTMTLVALAVVVPAVAGVVLGVAALALWLSRGRRG